jgi:hypothetical protein
VCAKSCSLWVVRVLYALIDEYIYEYSYSGMVLAAVCWAVSAQETVLRDRALNLPTRALFLPTFSHFLIVNKTYLLSCQCWATNAQRRCHPVSHLFDSQYTSLSLSPPPPVCVSHTRTGERERERERDCSIGKGLFNQQLLYLLQRLGPNPKKQQADATRAARELVHKQSARSRSCGESVGERTCSHVHI